MRYFVNILLVFMLSATGYCQELVANGSFEEENICSEFTKNCAPEAWIGNTFLINYYFDTEAWAMDGNHFVGLIAGNKQLQSFRSFIRTRLLCGLRKGHKYRLQFYARSRHDVMDSIGVYFSPTDFLFETKAYTQLQPSLVFRDTVSNFTLEKRQWRKISFDYTATGDENYITIGSFKKQEYKFSNPPEYKGNYYLYFDAVTFMPEDDHELICKGADSLKHTIYGENQRHSVLENRIAFYRKNVPKELPPSLTVMQRIDTLIIPDILFATASAKLNETSFRVLDSFCVALSKQDIDSVIFNGHTDSVGTFIYNNKLSADRAGSVSSYIKNKLTLNENLVRNYHYAYLKPVASNATVTGRQKNRRVEIYLYTHE